MSPKCDLPPKKSSIPKIRLIIMGPVRSGSSSTSGLGTSTFSTVRKRYLILRGQMPISSKRGGSPFQSKFILSSPFISFCFRIIISSFPKISSLSFKPPPVCLSPLQFILGSGFSTFMLIISCQSASSSNGSLNSTLPKSMYLFSAQIINNNSLKKNSTNYNPKINKNMSVSSVTVGGKIKYKLVLLGNQHVGKSSIIDRFINDRFEDSYNATIGIDFLVRNIMHNGKTYRLQLWDTAGQERFKALIPSYLKDSNCALIVYDVNDPKSLESCQRWLEFYNEHKEDSAFGVLVGNKNDLAGYKESCTEEQINEMGKKLKVPSYRISAKTGEGVSQLFIHIIDHIYEFQNQAKVLTPAIEEKMEEEDGKSKVNNIKLDENIHQDVTVTKTCC